VDREIPIIGDAILVDPEFGTGAVKVTPAHDPNDFEVGKRHNLEFITIFDESAAVNERGGEAFRGMDRFEARKAVKRAIADLGLDHGTKEHLMAVGRSQRSGAIVEPMISTQWFVKIAPLAGPAIEAVENGKIRFVPKQWANTYFSWMREIRDWCISRQLWWGHQIPAFHCRTCGHITVSIDDATVCESCQSEDIERDPDVLDTWFSSGLWPFSTLGWPEHTHDLKTYYPTTVLVTASDIIFFWVARMIMMGLHVMKEVPFADVYIHGLMRDEKGRKISKSLGNNIDPVEVIETYGADAYRFFLMSTLTEGKDSTYSESRLKGYQNFANKVWNSSRFVLMNLPDGFRPAFDPASPHLEAEDRWILLRLNETIDEMERTIGEYRFHLTADAIYSFIWNLYCDWYVELIKPRLYGKTGEASAESARQTAFYVLDAMLGLLNPFMPFITEELNSHLNRIRTGRSDVPPDEMMIVRPWPQQIALSEEAKRAAEGLTLLQEIIGATRTIRAEAGIAPDKKVRIVVRSASETLKRVLAEKEVSVLRLAQAESITIDASYKSGKFDSMEPFSQGEVLLPLEGVLDIDKERARLSQDAAKIEEKIAGIQKKLENPSFVQNAPTDVVEKEREKIAEMGEKLDAIRSALRRFGGP
jgi:valyl-tRNA synthetase